MFFWGGGKIREGVVRYLPVTNSGFLLGVHTSVPILVKIDQEVRLRVLADGQTLTDANRSYNLSDAVCYSCGTDKNTKETNTETNSLT